MQEIVGGSRGGSNNSRSTMEEREWRGRSGWVGGGREVYIGGPEI
jgi:hypothetical protein